ncbi:hypothetical protein Tco_1286452 [Tanacetum coccineum]
MSCNNDMKDEKSSDTESPINKMHELKIRDEFLKIHRDNAFNGTDKGDVIDHISKILEITKWIKIPDVDMNELRLHVFSKSLSGDAKQWWNNKIEGTNIGWNEMCNKFSYKYYPLSHSCNSKVPEIDKNTQNGLWEIYAKERTKGTIGDLDDEPREENYQKTCSDSFYKPFLDAQDGKDIYEIIDMEYVGTKITFTLPLLNKKVKRRYEEIVERCRERNLREAKENG